MFKRFFSIFLVSAMVIPYLLIPVYLEYEIWQTKRDIKHQIIAGMDRSELVHFTFTREEERQLEWEHSKEFEYRGEMYDVVEKETKGDKTTYWVWWDNEETQLNRQLKQLLVKALGEDSPFGEEESIEDFFEVQEYVFQEPAFWNTLLNEKKPFVPATNDALLNSYMAEIIPPPPRV